MRRAQRWVAGVATAALLTTMSASPAAAAAAGAGAPRKQDAARISGFLGGNVWTLFGFGSCAELVMELRR
ncbi:hypothetical protein ET989_08280 [Propioniciclava sinopodophylli]|uniref:Uncharacterized protein n=1 Tax=Propioniciclava sinopodophylli TaxID=1837344 RepID=A0A4Q9KDC4_9ACTN|nr:hypothetical protein [Propioniciclava sinopodophylli]TBT84651.1 hypothetical protein ET989_08280 [Propioniciclava sinopodophylli]